MKKYKAPILQSFIMMMILSSMSYSKENCGLIEDKIKNSPEINKIRKIIKTRGEKGDLSLTIRNLRGLEKEIPFEECTIIGQNKACEAFKKDAIFIASQGTNMALKFFWENPSDPSALKVKIASRSTICTYTILNNSKIINDPLKCKATDYCKNNGGWFNW